MLNGKHYDSLNPEGVSDPVKLKFFKENLYECTSIRHFINLVEKL
jgi:hypothetical protein